jgi:hypothetical protein
VDYFVWDGAAAVFYGQAYSDAVDYVEPWYSYEIDVWWDGTAAAWYDIARYQVFLVKQGNGTGQVTSDPPGIQCGSTCDASFDAGTTVTLTATAGPSSLFAGWTAWPGECQSTGPCAVTLDTSRQVTATFVATSLDLVVSKTGSGSGQVTSSPAAITCGATCQATFSPGSTVNLSATPSAGSLFVGWSGDCSGTAVCQVVMDRARTVYATFVPIKYRPDALIRYSSTVTWLGDGLYDAAAAGQDITTVAARGMTFSFEIAAENDGNVSDSLSIKGPAATKGFTLRYFEDTTNVTSAVVQGSYSTGPLAPDERDILRVTVLVGSIPRVGTSGSFLTTVASHGLVDGVKAIVTVGK